MILGKNIIAMHVEDARRILKRLTPTSKADVAQLQKDGLFDLEDSLRRAIREFDDAEEQLWNEEDD